MGDPRSGCKRLLRLRQPAEAEVRIPFDRERECLTLAIADLVLDRPALDGQGQRLPGRIRAQIGVREVAEDPAEPEAVAAAAEDGGGALVEVDRLAPSARVRGDVPECAEAAGLTALLPLGPESVEGVLEHGPPARGVAP